MRSATKASAAPTPAGRGHLLGYARVSTIDQQPAAAGRRADRGRLGAGVRRPGEREPGPPPGAGPGPGGPAARGHAVVRRLNRLGRSLKHLIQDDERPRRARDRVPVAAGGDRHHYPGGAAGVPPVREPGGSVNGPDRGTDPRRSRRGADPWPEGPCGLGDEGFAESGEVGVTLDPAELERTYKPMRQSDWIVFSSGNTSDRYYDWDHVAVEFDRVRTGVRFCRRSQSTRRSSGTSSTGPEPIPCSA